MAAGRKPVKAAAKCEDNKVRSKMAEFIDGQQVYLTVDLTDEADPLFAGDEGYAVLVDGEWGVRFDRYPGQTSYSRMNNGQIIKIIDVCEPVTDRAMTMDETIDDLNDLIADCEERASNEKAKLAYAKSGDCFMPNWIAAMESRIQRFHAEAAVYRFQLALAKSLIYARGIIPDEYWN
jgi:hypothetical protein